MLFLHTENMTKAQTTLTDVVSFLQHAALRQAGYPQVPLHPQSIQLILHYVLSLRQREKHLHVICHTHEQRCIKQTHIEIILFFPWPHYHPLNQHTQKSVGIASTFTHDAFPDFLSSVTALSNWGTETACWSERATSRRNSRQMRIILSCASCKATVVESTKKNKELKLSTVVRSSLNCSNALWTHTSNERTQTGLCTVNTCQSVCASHFIIFRKLLLERKFMQNK